MIKEFKDECFFLSNYYPCEVFYEGGYYKSSEAAYQSFKTEKLRMRAIFTYLPADESRYLGRHIEVRPDWEEVKDEIMYQIVKAKFTQNTILKTQLLATGDEELVEGTTWHDTYWGIDLETGEGQNKLGKILMRVREELR